MRKVDFRSFFMSETNEKTLRTSTFPVKMCSMYIIFFHGFVREKTRDLFSFSTSCTRLLAKKDPRLLPIPGNTVYTTIFHKNVEGLIAFFVNIQLFFAK